MDIGVLVASILRKLAPKRAETVRFTPLAGEALLRYEWPLNTRELEQCLATGKSRRSGKSDVQGANAGT